MAEVVAVDLLFNHDRLDMEAIAFNQVKNWLQIGRAIGRACCLLVCALVRPVAGAGR